MSQTVSLPEGVFTQLQSLQSRCASWLLPYTAIRAFPSFAHTIGMSALKMKGPGILMKTMADYGSLPQKITYIC
jgi:hypothetical protein